MMNIKQVEKESLNYVYFVLARGDMALLYSVSDLYWKCKELIEYTKCVNKDIYIATDLLVSLESHIMPSRADIFDISFFCDLGCENFLLRNHFSSVIRKVELIDEILLNSRHKRGRGK